MNSITIIIVIGEFMSIISDWAVKHIIPWLSITHLPWIAMDIYRNILINVPQDFLGNYWGF